MRGSLLFIAGPAREMYASTFTETVPQVGDTEQDVAAAEQE